MANSVVDQLATRLQTLCTDSGSISQLSLLLPPTAQPHLVGDLVNSVCSARSTDCVFEKNLDQKSQNGMRPYTWRGPMKHSFANVMETLLDSINSAPLDFWLSHPTCNEAGEFNESLHNSKFRFNVCEFSLGAFIDPFIFSEHGKVSGSSSITFDFNRDELLVNMRDTNKIDVSFSQLKNLFIVQPQMSTEGLRYTIFIYFTSVPHLWGRSAGGKSFIRILNLPDVDSHVIGNCSALRFSLNSVETAYLMTLMDKLVASQFNVYWARVNIEPAPATPDVWSDIGNAPWPIRWLFSEGFRVTDQLTENDEIRFLIDHGDSLYAALQGPLTQHAIVKVKEEILAAVSKTTPSLNLIMLPDLPNYELIRKVIVTPMRLIFRPPTPVQMNRILREYGTKNFVAVSFRDEDSFHLLGNYGTQNTNLIKRIKNVLKQGLNIGGRVFEFLGCSNSQLRQHGCWMYAKDPKTDYTVNEIRRRVGDIANIRCVATYVARMGQAFSSSTKTVDLSGDQYVIKEEPDLSNDKYCFTDGVGRISQDMALQVARMYGLETRCSAFQIRLGGCKGVLTVDPTLPKGHVHIRPSMKKFQSNHKHLEVMEYSRPRALYMNRQVIVLLSQRDIPDEVFFNFQESFLHKLLNMFSSNDEACQVLCELDSDIDIQKLHKGGLDIVSDPFFRSMLLEKYEENIQALLRKTHIPIPTDEGRLMMGVADETRQLNYGQVFIQYSSDLKDSSSGTTIVRGHVMITKNPCFHPGDLRVFEAVDCQQLHHLVDCLVFPVQGERPHPNEMSGSDLDGDMYWVTWHPDLIIEENNSPMHFPKAESIKLDHQPNQQDIIEYIGEYIKNDRLGIIANAHLTHADNEEKGIYSEKCIKLAKLHSEAVDFPKTGKFPFMPKDLQPTKYPDFMMKRGETKYKSRKILGKLYRSVSQLWQSFCSYKKSVRKAGIFSKSINMLLEDVFAAHLLDHPYHEKAKAYYSDYARTMRFLLDTYGLQDEHSLLVGSIHKLNQNVLTKAELHERAMIMKAEVRKLRKKYLQVLRKRDLETDINVKALLWYKVAYTDGKFKSFCWIAWSELKSFIDKGQSGQLLSEPSNNTHSPKVNADNLEIQKDAFRFFQRAIQEAVPGLRCTLEHVDLSKWDIASNDVYIKLSGGVCQKAEFARLCSAIPNLNLNQRQLSFGSTGCYVTKRGIEQTVMVNNSMITLHIYYSGIYDELLPKVVKLLSESDLFRNSLQYFSNSWLMFGRQNIRDIITVLHLADMILHYMEASENESRSHFILRCFEWCTSFSNLSSLNRSSSQLWSLSSDDLRSVQTNLMEAFQFISLSASYDILSSNEDSESSPLIRRSIPMSENVVRRLLEMEVIISNILATRSGCRISIKQVDHRKGCLYFVEAFGSERQLKKLEDEIHHFEFVVSGLRNDFLGLAATESKIFFFEGVDGNTETLSIIPYRGPSNLRATDKDIYMIGFRDDNEICRTQPNFLSPEKIQKWENVLETARRHCDYQYHGDIRIMCRFSCFHLSLQTCQLSDVITVDMFHELFRQKQFRSSCFSYDIDPDRLDHYLKESLRLERGCTEYTTICTIERQNQEVINAVYDEDFNLKQLRHQPITLCQIQVIRKLPPQHCAKKVDIRIQYQTMRTVTGRHLEQYKEYSDLRKIVKVPYVNNRAASDMPHLSVRPDWRTRVKFIRQKKVQTYTYPDDIRQQIGDHLTVNMKIDISTVRENGFFNKRTGQARDIKEYTDVTVVLPTVPPLHYREEHRELMEKLVELCMKISNSIL